MSDLRLLPASLMLLVFTLAASTIRRSWACHFGKSLGKGLAFSEIVPLKRHVVGFAQGLDPHPVSNRC